MAKVTINKNLTQTARDLGVSLGALLKANPQLRDPDNIRSGTSLNVPGKRSLSAKDNAAQMSRVLSLSSTGVAGGATFGELAGGAPPPVADPATPLAGGIQLGDTAAPATAEGIAETQAARGSSLAEFFAARYGVTSKTPSDRRFRRDGRRFGLPAVPPTRPSTSSVAPSGTAANAAVINSLGLPPASTAVPGLRPGSQQAPSFSVAHLPPGSQEAPYFFTGGRGGDPRLFGIDEDNGERQVASTSGQTGSAADSPSFLQHVQSLSVSDDPLENRRARWMSQHAGPDSPVTLEYLVGNTLRERSEGNMAANASEFIWDEIALRRGLGESGPELLVSEGYIPHPLYVGLWVRQDSLGTSYSAYASPGTSSYSSRRTGRGSGGSSPYTGGSSAVSLYSWHIKI